MDNAQDFGLAQIYQIKGRVGRSDRLAYAYLLIPPRRQLSEVAQKRLTAVKEFARLGSGYKIAMRDLTIRGAGDLLGSDQSGFMVVNKKTLHQNQRPISKQQAIFQRSLHQMTLISWICINVSTQSRMRRC